MTIDNNYHRLKTSFSPIYQVIHDDKNSTFKLDVIEDEYNARYVGQFSLPTSEGNWANIPVYIFYTKIAHPKGSNWFGLYYNHLQGKVMITDGKPAVDTEWTGVEKNGIVLYSAYRHDYQTFDNGEINLMADGGKDYLRSSSPCNLVKIKIEQDGVIVFPFKKED